MHPTIMLFAAVVAVLLVLPAAPTAITGQLKAVVRSTDRDPSAGYLSPLVTQLSVDISTASTDVQKKVDYDQRLITAGYLLRVWDDSADGRADGVIKTVRVDLTRGAEGVVHSHTLTWGQLRALTAEQFHFDADAWDSAIGTAFVALKDERTGERLIMDAGDSVNFHFDTSATVESEFVAVTPAAGDLVYITRVDFEEILPAGAAVAEQNLAPVASRAGSRAALVRRNVLAGTQRGNLVAASVRRANRRAGRR